MKKVKFTKETKNILTVIIIGIALLGGVFAFYIFYPFYYKIGTASAQTWSNTDTFSLDDTIQLQKDPEKDFVVLNLADVQVYNFSLYNGDFLSAKRVITQMVAEKQPDLITLTGDNVTGPLNYQALHQLINLLDSFEIPWAPVMGNHDNDGSGDYNFVADEFAKSEYCIFNRGPNNLGVGNYVITIMENSNIIEALIMMDSHDDAVWTVQEDWYSWVVNGLSQ
ncbi:MAG: metallophosphoesterase [Spirochaetales bacterium]